MKNKHRVGNIVLAVALLFLMLLCVYLVFDRLSAKAIPAICPEVARATSCQISIVSTGGLRERDISGEGLDALIQQMTQVRCYRDGWSSDVHEGELYRLHFSDATGILAEMSLTSMGRLDIGSRSYELRPDNLSKYLELLLEDSAPLPSPHDTDTP